VGGRVIRIKFNGLLASGAGFVQLPLVVQGDAEVGVGGRVFRVECDGLPVADDGLVQLHLVDV
jgi:hypothetical protein